MLRLTPRKSISLFSGSAFASNIADMCDMKAKQLARTSISRLTTWFHGPHTRRGVMSVSNIMEKWGEMDFHIF